MQSGLRWVFVLVALGVYANATAQIYTCRAADGTKVFSDKRCGTDAKVVPEATGGKRPASKRPLPAKGSVKVPPKTGSKAPAPPPAIPKTALELDALLKQCDEGKVAACNEWTRSGGPNQLREKERQAQVACDGGSLSACEERYCSDGASSQCRAKVLDAARLAGQTWYLRSAAPKDANGATRYAVRCMWEGSRTTRDVGITCAARPGPQRCSDAGPERAFAQLAAAAASYCAVR